jgi:hypothetical protein
MPHAQRRRLAASIDASGIAIGEHPVSCSWSLADRATHVEVCWDPAQAPLALADGFGLLVGEVSVSLPRRIRLFGLHPVSSHHDRNGRLYISLADLQNLREQLASSFPGENGSSPRILGIFSSVPGASLHPTPELGAALREYCVVPPGLLLLTHSSDSMQLGAFFLWDELGLEQESRMLLPIAGFKAAAPGPVIVHEPPAPVPLARAAVAAPKPLPVAPLRLRFTLKGLALGISSALSLILATIAVVVVLQRPPAAPPAVSQAPARPAMAEVIPPADTGVSLGVVFEGKRMRILWNPEAAPIRFARRAYLAIQDGSVSRNLPLTASELQGGATSYSPLNQDLTLRLVAVSGNHEFSESLRVLTTDSAPEMNVTQVVRPPDRLAEASRVPDSPTPAQPVPSNRPAPKRFVPVPLTKAESNDPIAPPPESNLRAADLLTHAGPLQLPSLETVVPSARPRNASSLGDVTSVVPPKPKVRFPLPSTEHLRRFITTEVTIAVSLKLDANGKVIQTQAPPQKDVYAQGLADIAVLTARQWQFEPALRNGAAIPGEFILVFRFRPQ